MNKNIVLRILGIVGGLLVIAGLFLPFIKDAGSLWKICTTTKQVYLFGALVLFGLLPVVLYGIDRKTEYAYMSVGALLFFVVCQLTNIVSANSIKSLDIGFYVMTVGIVLVAIVTFILNKSGRVKTLDEQIAPMSNDISNPLERKGLDVSIGQDNIQDPIIDTGISNDPLQVQNTDVNNAPENNNVIEALGEEIPEYQPEDGVNPVLAEFTTEQPAQTAVEPSINQTPAPLEQPVAPQPSVDNNVQVSSVEGQPPVAPAPEVVSTPAAPQPEVPQMAEAVGEVSAPTNVEQSQPDIAFDEPAQQEIQQPAEPQFDIFGQPK